MGGGVKTSNFDKPVLCLWVLQEILIIGLGLYSVLVHSFLENFELMPLTDEVADFGIKLNTLSFRAERLRACDVLMTFKKL